MPPALDTPRPAALQRCLNSPYLREDASRRALAPEELAAARAWLDQAERSFASADEATGLKQAWSGAFRAARALVYAAGYAVEQLTCLEVVLRAHFPEAITQADITELRRAQELLGPPDAALARAHRWLEQAEGLVKREMASS